MRNYLDLYLILAVLLPSDRLEWDEQMYQLFGVTPETFDCTLEAVIACLHPDDRDYFQQHLSHTLTQGSEHSIEYRVIFEDRSYRLCWRNESTTSLSRRI